MAHMAGYGLLQTGEQLSKLISKCTWQKENNVMVTLSLAKVWSKTSNVTREIQFWIISIRDEYSKLKTPEKLFEIQNKMVCGGGIGLAPSKQTLTTDLDSNFAIS